MTGKLRSPGLIAILAALSAWAFYATWGMSVLDGTLSHMLRLRSLDVPHIPGTSEPLRLHFTGITIIDYWFTIMVLFFWQAVDGSHPATTLTGIYFLGQLIAVWTLIFVEGNRVGNAGRLVARTLLWTLLMQNFTLGCFGPIYFAIHLETIDSGKGTASPSSLWQAAQKIKTLPLAVLLCFVIPSIWIALPAPTLASYASQQAAIAVWTPFPVWVAFAQAGLSWLDSWLFNPVAAAESGSAAYRRAVRNVYLFALVGSAIVHIAVVTVSLSTLLFPAIFADNITAELAPVRLMFPRNASAGTIGAGVLNFMQWDQWIGYAALLIWAWKLVQRDELSAAKSGGELVYASLLFAAEIAILGPGGAATLLLWLRDEECWVAQDLSVKPKPARTMHHHT